MSVFKRILVAVDGSATSGLALQKAVDLARDQGAELRLVHIVDAPPISSEAEFIDPTDIVEALKRSGEKILLDAQAKARQASVKADVDLLVIKGLAQRVPARLAKEAEDWSADLVVVGTHGRRGISHLLLGSTAEAVVRLSVTPVLLIRGPAEK